MPPDSCFAEMLADRRNEMRRPPASVSLSDIRAAAAAFMRLASGPGVARVDEVTIDGPGDAGLRLRLYRPSLDPDLPAVIFCHGGGFVFGDLDTHDALCRGLAVESGCVIVAVDYRRAPEHTFPAPIDDCLAAIAWVNAQSAALGLRASAVALAGDSAGAHIAIGTALTLRDRGAPVRHVALFYPVIDPGCDSASMTVLGKGGYLLTRAAMQWFWECYLPAPSRLDPRANALTADLRAFPSTTVLTAEFDPLRDEGESFAAHLRTALVPVAVHRCAGMIHGFAGMPQVTPHAAAATEWVGRALGRAF